MPLNALLSWGWFTKNKEQNEPEPLKEEEVIGIVQQALDSPSATTTKTSRGLSKQNSIQQTIKRNETPLPPASTSQKDAVNEDGDYVADPKVAEYFKDFPEPYREKAIGRFSKREGLHRFDIFRDFAMQHEWSVAMNRGVFLEDHREHKEHLDRERQKAMDKEIEAYTQKRREGQIPEWELRLRQYVPIADEESAGWKLFGVFNTIMLSAVLIRGGVKCRHSLTNVERWRVYSKMAAHFASAGVAGTAAVYRLMDWGPFDRSKDGKDAFTRIFEECREDLYELIRFIEDKTK